MFCRLLLVAFLFSSVSFAETEKVEFNDDELASESVLPVFDRPEPVKNRIVQKTNRLELSPNFGFTLNDPFYSGFNGGLAIGYHLSEYHAINLIGAFFSNDKSQYAKALEEDEFQDFENFPTVEYTLLFNYEFTPYYGKISITKQTVMNIDIFLNAGVGTIAIGGESGFAGSLGLGQKFYFSRSLGLRIDLKGLMYNGPDYTSVDNGGSNTDVSDPTIDDFDKEFTLRLLLMVGLEVLL